MQAALAIENVRLSNAIAERQVEQESTQATPTSELIAEQTPSVDTPARQDANLGAAPEQPSTHEVVAVLADMRGLARASERLAPEVVAEEILNVYFQVMNEAILRHNGYADKRFGDAVLAIFGHPQSRPDDTLRAVQTAIEMRQAAARLCARWRVRLGIDIGIGIGIARGRAVAFVPAVREHVARQIAAGDSATERREYALIGDAVTLAGRLQALARSGEVLAAAEVIEALDGAATAFDIEALQPLPIAGKTTPQRIYRIGEPGATQRRVTNPHDLLKGGPPTFR
jgi:adenylate cyclase